MMYNASAAMSLFHDEEVALGSDERKEMSKRRDTNRKRLTQGLARDEAPAPIGCHTQGSYAMYTMVQDEDCDYDIDDGVYFRAEQLVGARGAEMTPLQVRQMVCDALYNETFNDPPEVLKNCVRVYYNEGYHIDVPSYRRYETTDYWGQRIHEYELASSSWRKSDPKAVTKWFREKNRSLSPDFGDGQFRQVVRLLKLFSKSRSSWKGKNLSGFAITKIAADTYFARPGRIDQALRETMQSIYNRLLISQVIRHPVVEENLSEEGGSKAIHFRDRLAENLAHLNVLDDEECDHEQAMAAWDKVFCSDWFSEQPPPDDEDDDDGPNKAVRKRGGGRYASST